MQNRAEGQYTILAPCPAPPGDSTDWCITLTHIYRDIYISFKELINHTVRLGLIHRFLISIKSGLRLDVQGVRMSIQRGEKFSDICKTISIDINIDVLAKCSHVTNNHTNFLFFYYEPLSVPLVFSKLP